MKGGRTATATKSRRKRERNEVDGMSLLHPSVLAYFAALFRLYLPQHHQQQEGMRG
jgi:hypothetical protein